MSDYMSCIIEFKKEDCQPLLEKIKACKDHFSEAYITKDTYVVHFTGNHFDCSDGWMDILRTARKLDDREDGFFHSMVYSEEYGIEEEGEFWGYSAYVGLACDGEHFSAQQYDGFIKKTE